MTPQQQIPSPSSALLERIFRELDARLTELQTARNTIASLARPAQPELQTIDPQELLEAIPQLPEPQVEAVPPRRRGRPKGSRNRFPSAAARIVRAPEARALGNAIPSGPVVVSAAQLAKQRETPQVRRVAPAEPQLPAEGTLESLIQEMKRRTAA